MADVLMTLNFVKQVISGFAVEFAFGQKMYFVIDLFGITEVASRFARGIGGRECRPGSMLSL